jgi:hypothetical protein
MVHLIFEHLHQKDSLLLMIMATDGSIGEGGAQDLEYYQPSVHVSRG